MSQSAGYRPRDINNSFRFRGDIAQKKLLLSAASGAVKTVLYGAGIEPGLRPLNSLVMD
jgi:hypothetical protein